MPYDNEYNRKVANEVNYINNKYITHSDQTGQGTIDYTQSVNLSGSGVSSGRFIGGSALGGVAEYKGANANKKHYYEDDSSEYTSSEGEEEMEGGTRLGHHSRYSDTHQTDKFDQLMGGAILGLQQGTVIDGKKGKFKPQGKVNSMPSVTQSFGTLGVPADESKTREMIAFAGLPAADARLGIASKPVGSKIEGGKAGFAEGTFRDTGFEKVEGAVCKKGRGRPRKHKKEELEGGVITSQGAYLPQAPLYWDPVKGWTNKKPTVGKGRPKKHKKEDELEGGVITSQGAYLPQASMYWDPVKGWTYKKPTVGKGRPRKHKKEKENKLEGEGFSTKAISTITKKGGIGRTRDIVDTTSGDVNARFLGRGTTNTVKTVKSTPKMTLSGPVPKAQMPGSSMSGMGKGGKTARAQIVKKIMSEKGLSLIEASKYVKAHNLY